MLKETIYKDRIKLEMGDLNEREEILNKYGIDKFERLEMRVRDYFETINCEFDLSLYNKLVVDFKK